MKRRLWYPILVLALGATILAPVVHGEGGAAADSKTPPATKPNESPVPVAVLDFESTSAGNPDLGRQIGEVLMASLSGEPGIVLVDRVAMTRLLQEHELSRLGVVDPSQGAKIGKILGARILITGKAFTLDKEVFLTAKLIGTDTSVVEGIVVKGPRAADTGDLVMQLSQKVAELLRTGVPRLLANQETIADPLPALKAKLAGRKLPKVAVRITERHLTPLPAPRIDPAVDNKVRNVLLAAGFDIVEGTEGELDKAGVEVSITGEAFSELNARIGNLVSCSGRVELKAMQRKEGKVFFSDSTTTTAVDLAENIAGKTALEKGGRELCLRLLQDFADKLPPADKPAPGDKPAPNPEKPDKK